MKAHRLPSALAACIALLGGCAHTVAATRVDEGVVLVRTQLQMGTLVRIAVHAPRAPGAEVGFEAAFAAIDAVVDEMSEWEADSMISRVNREASATPVAVGPGLWRVLNVAIEVARASDGAFDPTWAGLSDAWCFVDGCGLPEREQVARALALVGWELVELDHASRTVHYRRDGVRVGLGGIAKGYALEMASNALCDAGACDHVIDAGGDVLARGAGPDGWRVGIAHPRAPGTLIDEVTLHDQAVVTSGDYQRYIEVDGVRYHHILDPRTGYPSGGAIQVSVVASDPTVADALATAAMVLGPDAGRALIERWPDADALIVAPDLRWVATEGWPGAPTL